MLPSWLRYSIIIGFLIFIGSGGLDRAKRKQTESHGQPKNQPQKPQTEARKARLTGKIWVQTRGGTGVKMAGIEVEIYSVRQLREQMTWVNASLKEAAGRIGSSREELGSLLDKALGIPRENREAISRKQLAWPDCLAFERACSRFESKAESLRSDDSKAKIASFLPVWAALEKCRVATTKTDSDGEFITELPPGDYLLFAEGARTLPFGKTENYFWTARFEHDAQGGSYEISNENELISRVRAQLTARFGENPSRGDEEIIENMVRGMTREKLIVPRLHEFGLAELSPNTAMAEFENQRKADLNELSAAKSLIASFSDRAKQIYETDQRNLDSLRKRAVDGSAPAQFGLALRYLSANARLLDEAGNPFDARDEAIRLLKQSAMQGYTPAKNKLADLGVQ
jgi:hypothetical protein